MVRLPDNNESFLAALREACKRHGEQARIAGLTDVTARYINDIIAGRKNASLQLQKDIAKVFGCTLEIMLAWGDDIINGVKIPKQKLITLLKLDPEVIDIEQEKFPVVKTYDDEDTQLHFFCIHCNCWHHHGRGGKDYQYHEGRGGMAGHRGAHCIAQNSPFKEYGYILDVVGKFKDVRQKYKKGKTYLCPKCHNNYSAAYNGCECGYVNNGRKSKYPEIAKLYQSPHLAAISMGNPQLKPPKIINDEDQATNKTSTGQQTPIFSGKEGINISEGRLMTDLVLMSGTQYAEALWSNLKSFAEAVRKEGKVKELEKKVEDGFKQSSAEIAELKEMIRALGGAAPEKKSLTS